jgi:hypothetical protein
MRSVTLQGSIQAPKSPRSAASFTFSEHRVTADDPRRPTSRGFVPGRFVLTTVTVTAGFAQMAAAEEFSDNLPKS